MWWLLGILVGYYIYRWWKSTDQKLFKSKYVPKTNVFSVTDEPYVTKQVRVDRILDKISKSGVKSLTLGEKEFLNKQK
jgi:preprotein translocase subunit Sec63